jgi:hypothetical protein
MMCRRCEGEGVLTIRLGKPGSDRHAAYKGVWCVYPPRICAHCHGTGQERNKPPPAPYHGPIRIPNEDDIALWL